MEQRKKSALFDIALMLVVLAVMILIYCICFHVYKRSFNDFDENMPPFSYLLACSLIIQAPFFAFVGWMLMIVLRFEKIGLGISTLSALLPFMFFAFTAKTTSQPVNYFIILFFAGFFIFITGLSAILIQDKIKNKTRSFFITAGIISAIYFFFMLLTNKWFVMQSVSAKILGILLSCLAIFVPYLFEKFIRLITEREKIN